MNKPKAYIGIDPGFLPHPVSLTPKGREAIFNAARDNRITDAAADMESVIGDAPVGTEKMQGYDSPCHIHIHSIRNRLADPDGISGKAAIDGIVHAGILPDDTAKQIKAVSYSQEKAGKGQEKTIITLLWGV